MSSFCSALAVALDGLPGIWAIAGDTDGIDGAEEVAGAIVTPDTLARARAAGLEPAQRLGRQRRATACSRRWATRSSPGRP